MRVKRVCLMTAIALCVVVFFGTETSAAMGWYTCSIDQTGMSGSVTYVCLTDTRTPPAFTGQWYVLQPDYGKQLLAVVLTAMSTSRPVMVYLDPAQQYSYVNTVYLKQ